MKKSLNKVQLIEKIKAQLIANAAHIGLSDLTLQNMISSALESKPGTQIKECTNLGKGNSGLLEVEHKRCKFYHLMPHHPLPSCFDYSRVSSKLDPICALFGAMRREDKGRETIVNSETISRTNRYIKMYLNQLGHHRDRREYFFYWRKALVLLNSKAFQITAFNYVCANWHSEMSVKQVNKILEEVNEIASELRTEIKMKRVYIPKANGKIRPLGVPAKSWRVFLHMLNILIVWFRTGTDKDQHAYFPRKGVHTAWIEVMKRLDEPNIYEFDLNNFFPSVSLSANEEILRHYGIPSSVSGYLHKLNQSLTKLADKDLIDEKSDRQVLLTSEGNPNPNLPKDIQSLLKSLLSNLTKERKEWLISSEDFLAILPEGWTVYKEVGVPQGAATSCGLSTLSLHYIWERLSSTLLMYADDGLVFPPSCDEKPNLDDPSRGITQNESKSGWVKRNGEWEKPLKFLGLEYIPETNEAEAKLRAKTRNGSTKEFTLDRQLLVNMLNEKELMMWMKEEPNSEAFEETEEEVTIFMPKRRANILAHRLGYKSLLKYSDESSATLKHTRKTYEQVSKELKTANVLTWIENACERFKTYPTPLAQLFNGKGLCEMAHMYNLHEPTPSSTKIEAKWGSWLSDHLGKWIFEERFSFLNLDNFAQEISYAEFHKVWISLFKLKGEEINKKFFTGEYGQLRKRMVAHIRGLKLTIHNASTIAVSNLLSSGGRLHDDSNIKYCLVNKPTLSNKERETKIDESSKALRRNRRKLEKEFKRTYHVWPRKLLRVPPPT